MMPLGRAVTFVNARVLAGADVCSSIRFASRVLALDEPPRRRDAVVDLEGSFVLPGLINAHDHLELNHYGPLKRQARYENASDWIADLRPLIRTDPEIRRRSSIPLRDRLFAGGLKNLLSGVTTVAHHNPMYRGIRWHVPIRVVGRFGWAHSFALEREPVGANGEPGGEVWRRCEETPADAPFIVHAAEGVDSRASGELLRLDDEGCLRPNTVVVHGVALTEQTWQRVTRRGGSLVWCPASNEFLFGRTAPIRRLLDADAETASQVCLGSDSRLTGARDLLDEVRAAARLGEVTSAELLRMVTSAPRRILRLHQGGAIAVGAPADLVVLPAGAASAADALVAAARADIRFVAIGGRPMVAHPRFACAFAARRVGRRPIVVDGNERVSEAALARRIANAPVAESGVCAGRAR
jgi:cytosine/adenosine deaminase-related metal-dependent hydrolase